MCVRIIGDNCRDEPTPSKSQANPDEYQSKMNGKEGNAHTHTHAHQ